MKTLVITLFFTFICSAFTLTFTGRGFSKNKIKINIASTDCSNAGFTTDEFRELVQDAVDDYWNRVATSDLELSVAQVGSLDIDGLTQQDIFDADLVPTNTILAGCNDDAFSSGSNTLGGALMECDGSACRSVLIINARADSLVGTLSREEQVATIAHELGHGIGLGHSEYSYNLMYYRIGGKYQKWLGQDDIDGVTYLYPKEAPASCDFLPLFGSMGTIKDGGDDDQGPPGGFLIYCLIGALGAYTLAAKVRRHFP